MGKKIIYVLGIILTISIGTYFYWKEINKKHVKTIPEDSKKTEVEKPSLKFGTVDENGNVNFTLKDEIKFKKSSMEFSVSENLDNKIGEVKDFMISDEKEEKALSITGYYMSDETNHTAFPSIGHARANSIKNYISKKGISTKDINVAGELNDRMKIDTSNIMQNPLKFSIGKSVDNSEMIERIIREIQENPLSLNFNSGEFDTNLTPKQRMKVVNISTYLDKVEDAFCSITGHTDNTGSHSTNMTLGKKRAEFIKQYFTKSGIPNEKIAVSSKGENQPISTNKTKEGRAKNRRVVTSIK
ncbi:OmpA family protein [Tenacibaculum sp. 190524A05c]|uniref:OmpA family protein n=1 Tax=Tenacibaculum platacis TaxID=3137852 RepID=UPI0032B2C60C